MLFKFLWGDGKLDYGSVNLNHVNLVQRMGGTHPQDFVGGVYNSDSGVFSSVYKHGVHPKEHELRFMLEWDMAKYESKSLPDRYSGSVEDTEPEFNLSFLDDPHDELYPPVWENDRMRSDAKQKIKAHVLDALRRGGYDDADQWIYFTVFGSGASYNWDEDGDFDVQMWLDIDKYNEAHETPSTSDDLITATRSIVQTVNFPSFADLGLKEGASGAMLIQYYPKPGTGSRDENEAQKPYACYDMETDEWIVKPKPYTADFYGTHFLAIQNKANDIAQQAETLIDELQRNVLSFQFWSGLWSKYKNDHYQEAAEDAQDKADLNKKGVATLFEGVFGGRQEAYSPEGKGIEDERDATQKLLEVWGIFQKLKHYARAPLPWDEQDMPEAPKPKESMWKESDNQAPNMGAWGYVNGHLIIGQIHHQGIMMALINNGWTWEQLMEADQAWGWFTTYQAGKTIAVSFSSDAGFQTAASKVKQAFENLYPDYTIKTSSGWHGVDNADDYGSGISGKEHADWYATDEGKEGLKTWIQSPIPPPPGAEYVPPTPKIPGGGKPPPKKLQSYEVSFQTPDGNHSHVVLTAGSPEEAMQKAEDYFAKQGDEITALDAKLSMWKESSSVEDAGYGSFAYINGHLILADSHHQAIMGELLKKGWTWEEMMMANQCWGWWEKQGGYGDSAKRIEVRFSSDAGVQYKQLFDDCLDAFQQIFHLPAQQEPGGWTKSIEDTGKEYGQGLAGKDNIDYYLKNEKDFAGTFDETPIPPPPAQTEPESPHEQLQLFDHPVPGGGTPPPKKNTPLPTPQAPKLEEGQEVTVDNVNYSDNPPNLIGQTGNIVYVDHTDPSLPYKVEVEGHLLGTFWFGPDELKPLIPGGGVPPPKKITSIEKTAQWQDLMEKAQRLRQSGQVQISVNDPDHVVGTVQGDHDTYQTEIWRDDPSSQAITMWDCECPWSQYSWGRTRQWKKYEGRPCAHTLALFWEAQSNPPAQDQQQAPEQAPPVPTPGGGMVPQQGLVSPVPIPNVTLPVTNVPGQGVPPPGGPIQPEPVPAAAPGGAYSQPTTPQTAQGVINIPGALSHVKTTSDTKIGSPYGMAWQNLYNQIKGLYTIAQYGPGYLNTIYYRLTNGENPENVIADLPPEVREELQRNQHEAKAPQYGTAHFDPTELTAWIQQHGSLFYHIDRTRPGGWLGTDVPGMDNLPAITQEGLQPGKSGIVFLASANLFKLSEWNPGVWGTEPQYMVDVRSLSMQNIIEFHQDGVYTNEGLEPFAIIRYLGPVPPQAVMYNPQEKGRMVVAGTTMYHVAPRVERNNIEQMGLRPNWQGWNYLWDSPDVAEKYRKLKKSYNLKDYDLYAVDASDIPVKRDPWGVNGNSDVSPYPFYENDYWPGYRINTPIPPERLHLLGETMPRTAAFQNGDKVRCKFDVSGEDTVTNKEYLIPQNSTGEVVYSDDIETIVIFPLSGSYHSPHLVKVEGLTYEFYEDASANPFIKHPHH